MMMSGFVRGGEVRPLKMYASSSNSENFDLQIFFDEESKMEEAIVAY